MTDLATEHDCTACGAVVPAGYDFCLECGHSVGYRPAGGEPDERVDTNTGNVCPSCGAAHVVHLAHGHPQCESCGYMERP